MDRHERLVAVSGAASGYARRVEHPIAVRFRYLMNFLFLALVFALPAYGASIQGRVVGILCIITVLLPLLDCADQPGQFISCGRVIRNDRESIST